MSFKDIMELERIRKNNQYEINNNIYEKVKIRINSTVSAGYKDCIYSIPEFIIGYPLFNILKVSEFLIDKLRIEGFIVVLITYKDIFISWDTERYRKIVDNYGSSKERDKDRDNDRDRDRDRDRDKDDESNKYIDKINDDFISSISSVAKSKRKE